MIEEFNENGKSGLRLTEPENDTKMINCWLQYLKIKQSNKRIEYLEASNKKNKIWCYIATSINILLLLCW